METVKVDLEKLQLLNDRIAQAIEALNQVRMTTHGLQHSAVPYGQQPVGFGGVGVGSGVYGQGIGQSVGIYGQNVPQVGLQHSVSPWAQPVFPVGGAYGQSYPVGAYGQSLPVASQMVGHGINHSSPQVGQFGQVGRAPVMDPSWTQWVAQTFPFVASPFPPVG